MLFRRLEAQSKFVHITMFRIYASIPKWGEKETTKIGGEVDRINWAKKIEELTCNLKVRVQE